jgi:hypothetical protein
MTDAEDVRRIALSLPETIERAESLSFAVRGKGFVWPYRERVHPKKARVLQTDIVAVRVADEGEKEFLLTVDPETFFTTSHYDGYPAVLVRLAVISVERLEELLIDAWRSRAPRALVANFEAQTKD